MRSPFADSVLLVDYFIFFGNAPGIILGFFYTLTGKKKKKREIERELVFKQDYETRGDD